MFISSWLFYLYSHFNNYILTFMKKLLLLFISILIFNCSSDDSNNDNTTSIICEKAISIIPNFIDENSISIFWLVEDVGETQPDSWVLEIGPQGFAPGSGTSFSSIFNDYTFQNLTQQTTYDIYVKSKCGENTFGTNVGPISLTTDSACSTPSSIDSYAITSCSFNLNWFGEGENAWEIEFGEVGFTLGTGTIINTSFTDFSIQENVSPSTTYEVYIRANCGSQGYSNYSDALVVTTAQGGLDSSFFSGNYLLETVTDGTFTSQGFGDIFGTPVSVNVQSSANNMREFIVTYYPDGLTVAPFPFKLQLTNSGTILVQSNDTLGASCDTFTSIILGPSNDTQTFNVCDDSTIEFTFYELYQGSGGCNVSDFPVTIRLTKQ